MKIVIEIPKEFEKHFETDKFEDSLYRLSADANLIAGNYEQETAIMLIKAFKESKPAYDIDKVVEELKKKAIPVLDEDEHIVPESNIREPYEIEMISLSDAIEIVKRGGKE